MLSFSPLIIFFGVGSITSAPHFFCLNTFFKIFSVTVLSMPQVFEQSLLLFYRGKGTIRDLPCRGKRERDDESTQYKIPSA